MGGLGGSVGSMSGAFGGYTPPQSDGSSIAQDGDSHDVASQLGRPNRFVSYKLPGALPLASKRKAVGQKGRWRARKERDGRGNLANDPAFHTPFVPQSVPSSSKSFGQ